MFISKRLPSMLATAAVLAAAVTLGHVTEQQETVSEFTPNPPPEWIQSHGTFLEVRGTIHQYATGKTSVFFLMLDEAQPLTLAWVSKNENSWSVAGQGALPRDAAAEIGGVQTISFRLRVHQLHHASQNARLEILQDDEWRVVMEEKNILAGGVMEWVKQGGEVSTGIVGPVEMLDTQVSIKRIGTTLLVR